MFLLSLFVYPCVLAVVCFGGGLLVDRLGREPLPGALLLPVGFTLVVVLATLLTVLDATSELAAPAVALAALAGIGLAVRDRSRSLRPRREWVWPALAMALPFLALSTPVLLTGEPGLTGFVRIIDTGLQLDLAAFLVDHGRSLGQAAGDSSYLTTADRLLGAGYPGGAPATLASTAQLAGIDPIWAWQPFIAWMGGLLGLALYTLLGPAIGSRPGRALAAGVAAQPTILYSYALAAGIKELAGAFLVVLTVVLLVRAPRAGLALGLVLAASLSVINVGLAPWLGVALLVLLGPRLLTVARGRPRLRVPRLTGLLTLVAVVVVAVPSVAATVKLAPLLRSGGPADLGNLAAPVPVWSVLGPWLTPDHRYPLATDPGMETVTALLACFVAVLAALGLARAVLARDRGLVAAAAAVVVAVPFVIVRGNSWVELKAFTISAPIVVALGFAGAAALGGARWRRLEAAVVGIALAATILGGNLLVWRNEPVTPYKRFADLQRLNTRYAGQGPALLPAYGEFEGYLMRDVGLTSIIDMPDGAFSTEPPPAEGVFTQDLDGFAPDYFDRFSLLLMRRGDPSQSRPPAGWRLDRRTRFYDVWRRTADAPQVVAHLGLTGADPRPAGFCRTLATAVEEAGPGARIAYAGTTDGLILQPPGTAFPLTWPAQGAARLARGPGRVTFGVTVPAAGTYDVAIGGSFGRRVTVTVDGRALGSVRWRENYPQAFEPLGTTALTAGPHTFDIVRGGGSLLPGTGNELGPEGIITRIGPITLTRSGAGSTVEVVDPPAGLAACRDDQRPFDWMEVVRPR